MMKSTKLVQIGNKINPDILIKWKESISGNEKKRERLEEALLDNIKKHDNK